jgi:hypothetical protein
MKGPSIYARIVDKALALFGHEPPTQLQNQPHKHTLAANVANMLATCHNDTRFHSSFGQMGQCRRHKIEDVGTFCIGLSRHPYIHRGTKCNLPPRHRQPHLHYLRVDLPT